MADADEDVGYLYPRPSDRFEVGADTYYSTTHMYICITYNVHMRSAREYSPGRLISAEAILFLILRPKEPVVQWG